MVLALPLERFFVLAFDILPEALQREQDQQFELTRFHAVYQGWVIAESVLGNDVWWPDFARAFGVLSPEELERIYERLDPAERVLVDAKRDKALGPDRAPNSGRADKRRQKKAVDPEADRRRFEERLKRRGQG